MKWLAATLLGLVVLLQYRLWLSPDGVREVMQLKTEVTAQRTENEKLTLRNQQLAAEVHDLKQGFTALEERARSELGMIAANETYFQVVAPPAAAPVQAATAAASVAAR
jgi:cell division protein FtsB